MLGGMRNVDSVLNPRTALGILSILAWIQTLKQEVDFVERLMKKLSRQMERPTISLHFGFRSLEIKVKSDEL